MNVLHKIKMRFLKSETQHRVVKSIAAFAGGNIAGSILGAVGGVLVARYVEPEVNGQFRLFSIPLMYLTVLQFGTFDGLYRQIPFYIGKDQQEEVEKIASVAGAWNLFITVTVASGFLLYALWWAINGNIDNVIGWLSQALLCVVVFYGGYLGATYRTLDNFVVLARIQFIQAIISFCFVYAAALWGFYGLCLRATIPALIGVFLFQRARPLRINFKFQFSTFKQLIIVGVPLYIWATLNTTLWLAAEYSLMSVYSGIKWVGIFSVAVMIRESLSILPQSVHQIIMPRVVEKYARGEGAYSATKRSFQAALLLTLFMTCVVVVISFALDFFMPMFIPMYMDGIGLIKICLWFSVVQAASLPVSTLYATGGSWLYGRCILFGFLAFLASTWLLVTPLGGATAIIVGSLLGRIVRVFVAYVDIYRFTSKLVSIDNSL